MFHRQKPLIHLAREFYKSPFSCPPHHLVVVDPPEHLVATQIHYTVFELSRRGMSFEEGQKEDALSEKYRTSSFPNLFELDYNPSTLLWHL